MGFSAAGFFGQLNNDITDQKQYIRARVDEDRTYLREQGLKRQAGIQEQRSAYERAATSLIRRGADERTVLGTLEMDPQGLMMVYSDTKDDNRITGNNLNDMMSIAADYRSEASMEEILASILPTAQAMPNDTDPVTSRRRSIGSWLGLNVDEALSNEVYNRQIVGGMTGDQIMASLNLPIQAQGSNEGGVTYDFTAAVPAEPMRAADFRAHMQTVNDDYNLEGMIQELQASKVPGLEEGELQTINARIKGLEEADDLNGVLRLNAILDLGIAPGPNTTMLADTLGTRLFDPLQGFSSSSLSILLGAPEDTSDGAVNASGVPGGRVVDPVIDDGDPVVDPSGVPGDPAGLPDKEVEALPLDTPAIPVTEGNIDQFVDSYFAAHPGSFGIHVLFEGGTQPVLVTPDMAVESETPDLEFYKSVIPDQTDFFGRVITTTPLSTYEAKAPVEQDTPVTLGTDASGMRPRSRPGQEPLAVLEEAVSSMRPRLRPDQLGQTDQRPESAVVSAVLSDIEEINSPEFEEVFIALLREEDLNVRDELITSAVGTLRTLETVPENIETLLLLLDTLRQPVRRNPLTGPGRAPTQPTMWQAPNEDRNDPVSIPADKNFDDDFNRVAPTGPGSGLDELVNIYYDTLVNQDARGGPPSPARSLEGSGVNQLVNSYYDLLVNEDIRRNSSNTR